MVDRLLRERLPEHWSFGVTEDGRVFFVDDESRSTTWLHPVLGCPLQSGHYWDESLLDGWEMNFDLLGRPYYIDHRSGVTTYTHPLSQNSPEYSPPQMIRMKEEHPGLFNEKKSNVRKSFSRSKSLNDPPSAKRNHLAPVTQQGWLFRQEGGFLKTWKKRWCVLTECYLFMYKDQTESNDIGSIVLAGYRIDSSETMEKTPRRYAFMIGHKDTKDLHLAAETEEAMWNWINSLTEAAAVPPQSKQPFANDPAMGNKENTYPEDVRNPPSANPYSRQTSVNAPLNNSFQARGQLFDSEQPRNQYHLDNAKNQYNDLRRDENQFGIPDSTGHKQPSDLGYNGEYPIYGVVKRQKPGVDEGYNRSMIGQRQSINSEKRHSAFDVPAPSSTSTPVINPNNFDWSGNPERDPRLGPSLRMDPRTMTSMDSGRPGYRQDDRFPEGLPSTGLDGLGKGIRDSRTFAPVRDSWNSSGQFGPAVPSSESFSRNHPPVASAVNSFPQQRSPRQSAEFPVGGRHGSLRTPMEQALNTEDPAMRYLNPRYIHEQTRLDNNPRLSNAGHPRAEDGFNNNWSSRSDQRLNGSHSGSSMQMKRSPRDGDYSPPRPPVPAAMRNLYIDDIAETKTPHSRQDILLAKEISQKRLTEPIYFQFPESPPKQTSERSHNFPNDFSAQNTIYAQVLGPTQDPNRSSFKSDTLVDGSARKPGSIGRQQSIKLDRLEEDNRISQSANDLGDQDKEMGGFHGGAPYGQLNGMANGSQRVVWPNENSYASAKMSLSPRMDRRNPVQSRPIEPIKEDPDMADTDVLNTRTLEDMQKHMLGHARLRLSISVRDLVGKSQEELVLLLIQLRRSQAKLEELLTWAKNRLLSARPQEKAYKLERKNSIGRLEDALEHGHEYFVELQKQADEIEKQIDVTQPLINLIDNIVTMGSLYNGDNLMYASQYKKSQLRPDQVVPGKKMLEFSRMNQEERLASKQEQSLQQLTEDEVNLEEKLQQLYALDARLQEHSFAVTSLQDDKRMLEEMQDELKKAEKSESERFALERLAQQRQICEKNLTTVRQNLADASKLLEETSIENARVEQQVVLLRNKIHGGLVKTQSSPSLVNNGSGREIVKMEEEVKSIQVMMEGLASQGTKLSEAIENLKSGQPGAKAVAKTTSSAGYMETDLDTKKSRDISIRQDDKWQGNWPPTSSYMNPPKGYASDSLLSSQNLSFPSSAASLARRPNETPKFEYRYVTPPSAGQPGNPPRSRPGNQYGVPIDNQRSGQPEKPFQYGNQPGNQYGSQTRDLLDGPSGRQFASGNPYDSRLENEYKRRQQFGMGRISNPATQSPAARQEPFHRESYPGISSSITAANFNDGSNRQYGNSGPFPKDRVHPVSVRDVKKREISRRNPADFLSEDDDAHYTVLRRSRSLPRVHNANNAGFQDFGRQSMNEGQRRKSSYYLMLSPSKENVRSASAVQRLFPSSLHAPQVQGQRSGMDGMTRSQSFGTGLAPASRPDTEFPMYGRLTRGLPEGGRPHSITMATGRPGSGQDSLRPSFTSGLSAGVRQDGGNHPRPVFTTYNPAAGRENASARERDNMNGGAATTDIPTYDDSTIDNAVFHRPQPVEIPDRYVPDSSDEDESLTAEERLFRKERADHYKKIIAKQSLQEFRQGELTLQTGPVHHQLHDEARRREEILDVKRSLAQEVMLRSKEDAALRRKTGSSTGMLYSQDGYYD